MKLYVGWLRNVVCYLTVAFKHVWRMVWQINTQYDSTVLDNCLCEFLSLDGRDLPWYSLIDWSCDFLCVMRVWPSVDKGSDPARVQGSGWPESIIWSSGVYPIMCRIRRKIVVAPKSHNDKLELFHKCHNSGFVIITQRKILLEYVYSDSPYRAYREGILTGK